MVDKDKNIIGNFVLNKVSSLSIYKLKTRSLVIIYPLNNSQYFTLANTVKWVTV